MGPGLVDPIDQRTIRSCKVSRHGALRSVCTETQSDAQPERVPPTTYGQSDNESTPSSGPTRRKRQLSPAHRWRPDRNRAGRLRSGEPSGARPPHGDRADPDQSGDRPHHAIALDPNGTVDTVNDANHRWNFIGDSSQDPDGGFHVGDEYPPRLIVSDVVDANRAASS